jgi:hypothetical protein
MQLELMNYNDPERHINTEKLSVYLKTLKITGDGN